jgi:hypothetical protein
MQYVTTHNVILVAVYAGVILPFFTIGCTLWAAAVGCVRPA